MELFYILFYPRLTPFPFSSFSITLAQMVKNMPAMQETWVQSLGWEYRLEKRMATHSTVLAWKIGSDSKESA